MTKQKEDKPGTDMSELVQQFEDRFIKLLEAESAVRPVAPIPQVEETKIKEVPRIPEDIKEKPVPLPEARIQKPGLLERFFGKKK